MDFCKFYFVFSHWNNLFFLIFLSIFFSITVTAIRQSFLVAAFSYVWITFAHGTTARLPCLCRSGVKRPRNRMRRSTVRHRIRTNHGGDLAWKINPCAFAPTSSSSYNSMMVCDAGGGGRITYIHTPIEIVQTKRRTLSIDISIHFSISRFVFFSSTQIKRFCCSWNARESWHLHRK